MALIKQTPGMGQKKSVKSFERKMLLKKISGMADLPTPSMTVTKVIKLLRQEDIRIDAVVEQLEKDQTLVASILKLINSGYYGLKNQIDSVDRAVNLLGILRVKQMVYSASIMDLFSDEEKKDWEHAYSCSVLMNTLMKENDIPAASNLSLTMLMHDIGKVVLRRFTPQKHKMARIHALENELPLYKAEEMYMQINHAEAAGCLLEKWNMEPDIIQPVIEHHNYESVPEEYTLECALVQFVNWVDCRARSLECPAPPKSLMDAAGFESIDGGYWMRYQRDVIDMIENNNEAG